MALPDPFARRSCPSCGNAELPEFSQPAGLVLCPACGVLLRRWADAMVPVGLATETVTKRVLSRVRGDDITAADVDERVREFLAARLTVGNNHLRLAEHELKDLGLDSLDVVWLVMALEEEFGIDVDIH